MQNYKKISKFALINLSVLVIFGIVLSSIYDKYEKQKYGKLVIQYIEQFYIKNKRLPESIEISPIEGCLKTGPFYVKTTDSTYIIYYSEGFDEDYRYDSQKNTWYYYP